MTTINQGNANSGGLGFDSTDKTGDKHRNEWSKMCKISWTLWDPSNMRDVMQLQQMLNKNTDVSGRFKSSIIKSTKDTVQGTIQKLN